MEFNLAEINEAIAAAIPDREMMVWRGRRLTYAQVAERTRRLANYLHGRGLGAKRERSELAGWESGQDHVALYLYNCPEYIEGMLGAYKARTAPFNVNYRYVEEELVYLLRDSKARAIVYHAAFAPTLAKIRPQLPDLEVLLQVEDDSRHALLPGAVEYEAALASSSPARAPVEPSPDDLYILYTGGTTGMPKGVLWRQADIFVGALGGRGPGGAEPQSLAEIAERVKAGGAKSLPTPPLMHGAAHWASFNGFHSGSTVMFQDVTDRFDPHDVLGMVEREKINVMLIVGDAFARPLIDQLRVQSYDLSSLFALVSGGAALNATLKKELLELLPKVMIIDAIGSSETGSQAQNVSTEATGATTGTFNLGHGACVLSEDLSRILEPGHEGLGWFGQTGRVPLGYLGDRAKTERTFPAIAGVRYSVPGDRARLRADGILELLGRDSVTINSGGEKIFAEEVEHALKSHPAVFDAVVCGRPSERWGNEVVAIVRLREGKPASEKELLEECAKHLARYKLPKAFIFRDEIVRSPSGKADYRWAKQQATG
ncbi:MAG: acyl-CoA synthetase [Deltaproteobacteria bacterium]|nr:acyl-CoA synthetase [Deltaproteobacteria bacterium]